ncbi:MAG: sulfate/molybdate ABC transporter ATP-binding protein [Oscillospiraceae bacterium]
MSLSVEIYKDLGGFKLDVSFESDGGILGLLGASGCGKSYTLKCIAGIERPDRGRIVLDDVVLFDSEKRINLTPQQRRVGYLFQNYALFPNMTVRQNILSGLNWEKNRKKRESAMEEAIHLMQLDGLEKHRPSQLSGGQQQRVAMARILVNRPKLLLLDEPFSALDSHLKDKIQLEMNDILAKFGKGVILVTHSRDEAYHMCGRIAVMDDGRLLALKDTKKLFAEPEYHAVALLTGCKNFAAAKKVGEHEVEVPEWGIHLTTEQAVRDDIKEIAIRAHYFNTRTPSNRYPVSFVGGMEEPFEMILEFRYDNQRPNSPSLWWRVSKDRLPNPLPEELGIAPVNILPLYS